jgi:hypothetical protein
MKFLYLLPFLFFIGACASNSVSNSGMRVPASENVTCQDQDHSECTYSCPYPASSGTQCQIITGECPAPTEASANKFGSTITMEFNGRKDMNCH